MEAPAIELVGLARSYGDQTVLRDVSLEVRRGEIVALLGPNGAGKTTTVEIVEGYRRADRGTVRVLGTDPGRAGREHRARVGLMLQGGGGIDPRMTAREVITLHGRFHADPRATDEVLALVGLPKPVSRTRYRRLSGGERQRVALALALVGRPEVAVLDEPTAGMDVEGRAATRDLLASLRGEGVAILLTSHDLTEVERVADRIAVLDRGRVLALDGPAELSAVGPMVRFRLERPLSPVDHETLRVALGSVPLAPVGIASAGPADPTAGPVLEADGGPGRYRIAGVGPSPALLAALLSWLADRSILVAELRTGGGTLEERYLELIASSAAIGTADALTDPAGSLGGRPESGR